MNRTPRHAPESVLADRYRVVRTLFGGMGEVIVCHDLASPGQPLVALKTFAGGADHPPAALASLHDEADAWLRLGFGGMRLVQELLRVHAIGGRPYLVMPYCQRGSLRDWLARGDYPAPARMRYLTHVLVGLHELEAEGLVHRDLKPENVLISDEDRAVVTDLGLARDLREQQIAFLIGEASLGDQTSIAGTLPYMAPEQLAGRKDMDTRVDLWAFGVLAIEVLTGTRPFVEPSLRRPPRTLPTVRTRRRTSVHRCGGC